MYLSLLADLADRRAHMEGPQQVKDALLFSIPSLLNEEVLTVLSHQLSSDESLREALFPALQDLLAVRAALDNGDIPWLFGFGPMEMAIRACEQGDHTWDETAGRLSQDDFRFYFSPEYGDRLGRRYCHRAGNGEWKKVFEPMRLLLAITQNWRENKGWLPFDARWEDARAAVRLHWINLINEVLCQVSDGRLFREANKQVGQLLEEAEAAGNARLKEAAAFAGGVLHLDPYSAGLIATDATVALRRREASFILQNQRELSGMPEDEWRMPPMEQALANAANYLQMALVEPEGIMRGAVLKALAQVCVWQKQNGLEPTRDYKEVCRAALRHLNESEQADLRDAVLGYLNSEGGATVTRHDPVAPGAPADFGRLVEEVGQDRASHRVARAITALLPDQPEDAWALGRPFWPEIDRHCLESERLSFAALMHRCARVIAEKMGLAPFDGETVPAERSFSDYVEDFRHRQDRSNWADRECLLAACILADAASRLDGEGLLMELLTTISVGREAYEEFKPLLRYLQGALHQGEGANSWKRRDGPQAAVHYCRAIEGYVRDERPALAFQCLDYLRDVVVLYDYETALQLSACLAPQAVPLANSLGQVAIEPLQGIFKRVVGGLLPSGNMEAMLLVTQAAKAAAFACACTKPGERGQLDETGESDLSRIESLRAEYLETLPGAAQPIELGIDVETQLVSYVEPLGKPVDSSLKGRLTFASRCFDEREFAAASSSGVVAESDFHSIEELRQNLGDETVLLNLFLTVTPDEHEAWLVMCFTSEDSFVGVVRTDWPSSTVEMSDSSTSASLSGAALSVKIVRSAVQGELPPPPVPGAPPLSLEMILESCSRQFMGSVIEPLATLRKKGKSHLCIVPHGPLHYLPFHLLSPGGKPLADEWTVSYLPALQFLKKHHDTAQRTETAAVFGLDFDEYNPHRQAAIPDAITETRVIAAVLGTQAILNEQVTEERVTEALRTCRFVHLATHGEQEVRAPAFHNVLVAQDATSDGRLEAHELARLDLRGLELITLSACETSLGRFDRPDNPRGIPASLFQAGAETLIGTLWPVASDVASYFHIHFYEVLASGRGKLQAFRMAQQATRQAYPAYSHWGAFTFSGRW